MFSQEIKEKTKSEHVSLEKVVVKRIKGLRTLRDYENLLKRFYGYFQPVEKLIFAQISESSLPDLAVRRKAVRLLNDIAGNDAFAALPPTCEDLPEIAGKSSALGAMYVLEGSTLGGPHIAQMLRKQLSVPEERLSFFLGYKTSTAERWSVFIRFLENEITLHDSGDQVIATAREVFSKMQTWFSRERYLADTSDIMDYSPDE